MTAAELEARIIHRVGAAGGSCSPAALREYRGADAAVASLVEAGLLAADGAGALSPGPRGSALAGAAVESACAGGVYGHRVEVLPVAGSTNDEVLRRAAAGAAPGHVVCAELQTKGRGRRGRAFDSRPGLGIWSTILLEAPEDPERAPRLSLVAGLAVADAARKATGADPRLKWPNDVLIGGRKVCGILVEARTVGGRTFVVAGIGTNVHHRAEDFPGELRERAGSLESTTGARVGRSEYLARLLGALERRLGEEAAGRLDLEKEFSGVDALAGRSVEVRTADGAETGTAEGVAPDGTLRVRVGGALRSVRSGEATLRDAGPEESC